MQNCLARGIPRQSLASHEWAIISSVHDLLQTALASQKHLSYLYILVHESLLMKHSPNLLSLALTLASLMPAIGHRSRAREHELYPEGSTKRVFPHR